MATNDSPSTSPLSKLKAIIPTSNSTSTKSISPLSKASASDDSDTSILEPSDDEFDFEIEFEIVDDEEEWTDEQLMEYSRPGRRGKGSRL
jgi:hypothetical protein